MCPRRRRVPERGPLIPRESERSRKLYRSRGAVEREFGRLKNEWALASLRVRRIERGRLHADLTILEAVVRARPSARRAARGVGTLAVCERY